MRIGDDSTIFRILNEEWITTHFALESKDRETLQGAENTILCKGGSVFMACIHREAVGCIALIPMGDRKFVSSKWPSRPL